MSAPATIPTPPAPKKLANNCPRNCSLRREAIGEQAALAMKAMRENGAGRRVIKPRLEGLLGRPVSDSVLDRHLKHYVEVADAPQLDENAPKPTDLLIVDAIIGAGYRNSRNWKPTIRDTLDAMKLKMQMTGLSAFEDMLKAMDEALTLPDDENEAPEAEKSAEERSQEGSDVE